MILRKKKTIPIQIDTENMQLSDNLHLEEVMTKEAQLQSMQKCIEQLTFQQREAIDLFYLKGKCYKEIANHTNMEVNKIKSHIQNGRRNLKLCMDKTN
jgi:RNA polymerase sigma-70 factor (ECF subfamily)